MRLRRKPWAPQLIADNPQWILVNPKNMAGNWQTRFKRVQPLYIEVGSGKGKFITEMAQKHPENNYVAVEIQESAIAMVLKKQVELQLSNLQLLLGDGAALTHFFAPNEVSGIYLNFSDPWPKTRHEKRRLTYRTFLAQYQAIIKPAGQLVFKTDNRGLFEYSLVSMNNFNMIFDDISLDLHAINDPENVETEYEEKFSNMGQPIYRLKAHFR